MTNSQIAVDKRDDSGRRESVDRRDQEQPVDDDRRSGDRRDGVDRRDEGD